MANNILFRKNYLFKERNPDGSTACEFTRVRATLMELEFLSRLYKRNNKFFAIYESRDQSKKNSVSFDDFIKSRGIYFSVGRLVQGKVKEPGYQRRPLALTITVLLLSSMALASLLLSV